MKYIYRLTIILLLVPGVLWATNEPQRKRHEKSKTIKKSFDVNRNATLSISNKYGDINVTTWNQNRIEIDVKITVKGNDVDRVEERLEKIDVEFDNTSNMVKAKTILGNSRSNWSLWGRKKNLSYKINYTVKMPVTNHVNLSNDYGGISLNELEGDANINCDYGKISIGDLKGEDSNINLDYCSNSTINSMVNGTVTVDYSRITIENAGNIRLDADYSTVKFKTMESLAFNTDYGNVEVDKVTSASGNGDYTGFRFGTITKKLKLSSDYGSIRVGNLEKGFESVVIDSEFAGIKIGISPGNSFSFSVDLQYARFKKEKSKVDLIKSIEKNSKKYYEGNYGKENSNSKVTIKSQYGSVHFYEN